MSCRPKDSRFPKELICDNKKFRISLTYIRILETCICRILKRIVVSYFNSMQVKIISLTILLNIDDITDYWTCSQLSQAITIHSFLFTYSFLNDAFLGKDNYHLILKIILWEFWELTSTEQRYKF